MMGKVMTSCFTQPCAEGCKGQNYILHLLHKVIFSLHSEKNFVNRSCSNLHEFLINFQFPVKQTSLAQNTRCSRSSKNRLSCDNALQFLEDSISCCRKKDFKNQVFSFSEFCEKNELCFCGYHDHNFDTNIPKLCNNHVGQSTCQKYQCFHDLKGLYQGQNKAKVKFSLVVKALAMKINFRFWVTAATWFNSATKTVVRIKAG